MTDSNHDLFASEPAPLETLDALLREADAVYLKKLSLNDWQWTENTDAHQGGVYIPAEARDSGFFPKLSRKERKTTGHEIFECFFDIDWIIPAERKKARLVNYRSKGEETHLTRLVKSEFAQISPASLLVIFRMAKSESAIPQYRAMVADSSGPAFERLADIFDLKCDFHSDIRIPRKALDSAARRAEVFLNDAVDAFFEGRFSSFSKAHERMPDTVEMAELARRAFFQTSGLKSLNPFALRTPGDAVMTISRDIEYGIFKEYQLRARACELIKTIFGDDPGKTSPQAAVRAAISNFDDINRIFLSAGQQRKSRAGYSFEHHLKRMLLDGDIPHEEQVVIESKKRPDFILPSLRVYKDASRNTEDALVLSLKTTLKERWKQVHGEIKNCDLYLGTLDENIAANAIEDMATQGIRLVVPESLKNSDVTTYRHMPNVISFSEFFSKDIRTKRFPIWSHLGLLKK